MMSAWEIKDSIVALTEGLDEVGLTLQSDAAIRAYEDRQRKDQPWLASGTLVNAA